MSIGKHVVRRYGTVWIACAMLVPGIAIAAPNDAAGGPVTFTKDVAPILFENCLTCHRPGEVAPMSLRTFEEARPWAKSIQTMVQKRAMPPWFADPAHGKFRNDTSLSDDEIATIVNWVDQGAVQGDLVDLPELPEFTSDWHLGEPDFIIELPEVNIPADGGDYFPDLAVTLDVPEKRWVHAVEVRPSNREVAHHVVLFANGGGGMGSNGFFDVLAVWAVGTPPTQYPEGMGRWVYPGQRINTNMHYHPSGEPSTDQTRVGLYFGEGEMQKEITAALAGTMAFEIPAGVASHDVKASYIIDQDVRIVSFFPHMHFRGKSMTLTAALPDGSVQTLLNVPKYDFDWQLFYYPEDPVFVPAGSRVDILANYDNSENNPDNPDPTRSVGFGIESVDEMMFGLFEFIPDKGVSPVPASDEKRIQALLDSLPSDSVYGVNFEFGNMKIPTCLQLPREGDGTWYIPLERQVFNLTASNIQWDGGNYSFEIKFQIGGMNVVGGNFKVAGTVDDAGRIEGGFESGLENSSGGRSFFPFTNFSGFRADAMKTVETGD